MTAPTEPTPGAPEPGSQLAPPASPAPPAEDIASLPDWAQKQIRDARAEAGKARTDAKAAAAAEARQALSVDIAKALGLTTDEPPDPAALTAQVEHARDQAWAAHLENQILRMAPGLGADSDSLLDSVTFLGSLDELGDLDPASDEFKTKLQAKVQAAAAKHPARSGTGQASTPRPDPSQGAKSPTRVRASSLTEAVANQRKQLAG